MAFQLDKVTEYGQIEADDANPRRKRARIGARRIRRRNAQGQVVAYEATDTAGDLDVLCAALNVRASQANSNFRILSNDRSRILLTKRVRLQQRVAGNWENVAANPVNYRTVTKPNRGPDFAAWRWVYRLPNVARLEVEFAQELGSGKWEYEATNLSAASVEYRIVQRMDLVESATARIPLYQQASIDAPPVHVGYRLGFEGQESISVNWSDMGADFASVRADATFGAGSSIDIFSTPFTLAPGASKLIDPTYTSDAGWSGHATASGGSWGIDNGSGGSHGIGFVSGNELRTVMRFPIVDIPDTATINSISLRYSIVNTNAAGSSFGRFGAHAGNGQTDPQGETFSTSWTNSDNSSDYYVTGITDVRTNGTYTQDLGSGAVSDVQAALSPVSSFSLSLNGYGGAGNSFMQPGSYNNSTAANQPDFIVVYTEASGTQYDRTIAPSISISQSLSSVSSRLRTIAASASTSASASAQTTRPRTLSASSTVSASVSRLASRALAIAASITIAASVAVMSSRFRTISAGVSLAASLAALFVHLISISGGIALSAIRSNLVAHLITISAIAALTASISRVSARLRTIAAGISSSASVASSRTRLVSIAAAASLAASLAYSSVVMHFTTIGATVALAASLSRTSARQRTIAASASTAASFSRLQTLSRSISASMTASPTISRGMSLSRTIATSIVLTPVITFGRAIFRTLSVGFSLLSAFVALFIPGGTSGPTTITLDGAGWAPHEISLSGDGFA